MLERMNRAQMNILEKRLVTMRISMLHLGKLGMPYSYYEREFAILQNTMNACRRELEQEEIQQKLFD